jgi:hypothetical protein
MKSVPLSRLSDDAVIRELKESVAQDGLHTARQVALIAEVRRRRLYAAAGYASMYRYCLGELHLSEDAAWKRLQVAGAARDCPAVLAALAEGRVHLSGLALLATHLTPGNADELVAAASHRSKREIERMLADRFPKADLPARVRPISEPTLAFSAPEERSIQLQPIVNTESEPAPGQVDGHVIPSQAAARAALIPAVVRARLTPLSPQRYGVQFTLDEAGHDLLRQVQDLLGHEVPRGDLAEVFVRALKAYAALLEKLKHAATEHPRPPRRQKPGTRRVSAHVKRAVRKRDKGQCTDVNEAGRRCEERSNLEYDHILEFARGGDATVSNIRLRCRAHNRLGAERTYGAKFMRHKIEKTAESHGGTVTAT